MENSKAECENAYEYEIKLNVFARVLKKRHPAKLHFTFFTKKGNTVIYTEGNLALSRWQNDKNSYS